MLEVVSTKSLRDCDLSVIFNNDARSYKNNKSKKNRNAAYRRIARY